MVVLKSFFLMSYVNFENLINTTDPKNEKYKIFLRKLILVKEAAIFMLCKVFQTTKLNDFSVNAYNKMILLLESYKTYLSITKIWVKLFIEIKGSEIKMFLIHKQNCNVVSFNTKSLN